MQTDNRQAALRQRSIVQVQESGSTKSTVHLHKFTVAGALPAAVHVDT